MVHWFEKAGHCFFLFLFLFFCFCFFVFVLFCFLIHTFFFRLIPQVGPVRSLLNGLGPTYGIGLFLLLRINLNFISAKAPPPPRGGRRKHETCNCWFLQLVCNRPLALWRQKAQSGWQNKRFFLSWELKSIVLSFTLSCIPTNR